MLVQERLLGDVLEGAVSSRFRGSNDGCFDGILVLPVQNREPEGLEGGRNVLGPDFLEDDTRRVGFAERGLGVVSPDVSLSST